MQKRSKIENFVFTLVMAFVMVYAMVCYNIAIDKGGMSNEIFALAFKEIPIMWPIAVILEMLIAERLAIKLAFKIVTPKTNPAIITFTISAMIVCIMCPAMSFIATCLFAHPGKEIIAVWLQKWVLNFPMAMFFQIFFAGPAVRGIFSAFGKIGKKEKSRKSRSVKNRAKLLRQKQNSAQKSRGAKALRRFYYMQF